MWGGLGAGGRKRKQRQGKDKVVVVGEGGSGREHASEALEQVRQAKGTGERMDIPALPAYSSTPFGDC